MIHFVYLLRCNDGEYYTGIAADIKARIREHARGECRSTAYLLPIKLKWFAGFTNKRLASRFEAYLKSHSGRRFRNRFLR